MRPVSLRPVLIAGLVVVVMGGCAKTNMTNLWKNPDGGTPMQSVLVISLEHEQDLRRIWEDALTAEFQANGVMARPSYGLFPASMPDSQQVVTVTRRDKYDGVVVTHRIAATHTGKFDSDYAKTPPGASNDYWRGWYHTHYLQATEYSLPKEGKAQFQIDVANTAGRGTLLWTGTTTPVDPRKADKVQVEVCGELVSELVRQGFVAKRK